MSEPETSTVGLSRAPATLYKYVSPLGLRYLMGLTVRFSPLSSLNDPFELFPRAGSFLRAMDGLANTAFPRAGVRKLDVGASHDQAALARLSVWRATRRRSDSRVGILSLTTRDTNTLLWAHYGSSYQGVAVGLDRNCELIERAGLDGIVGPQQVIYGDSRPAMRPGRLTSEQGLRDLYLSKGMEWSYEEEVRCLRDLNSIEPMRDRPIGVMPLDKAAIRSITIGMGFLLLSNKDAEDLLVDVWRFAGNRIDLRVAIPHPDSFKIESFPLPSRHDLFRFLRRADLEERVQRGSASAPPSSDPLSSSAR
jgi:hypothetical protein